MIYCKMSFSNKSTFNMNCVEMSLFRLYYKIKCLIQNSVDKLLKQHHLQICSLKTGKGIRFNIGGNLYSL